MITKESISEVLEKVSILDVVGSRVQLVKAGNSYKGLCPFHLEKTPSFIVTEHKGVCHCFGCNAGGNVIKFVMEYESLTFPEAVQRIADEHNIKLTYEHSSQSNVSSANKDIPPESTSKLLEVLNSTFCKKRTVSTEKNESTRLELSATTCDRYSLGYAHQNRQLFSLIEKDKSLLAIAKHINLNKHSLTTHDGECRISLPIYDHNGAIVGMYVHGATPRIIGPKSQNYKNLTFGLDSLSRTTKIKFIVDNPITAIQCIDAGMTDVVSTFTHETMFNNYLVDKGRKERNILVINNSAEKFENLKSSLLSYFYSRKSNSTLSILLLPPNTSLASIYKKNGMPIVEKLIDKNTISWDGLLAKIISDDLKQRGKNSAEEVSDLILDLFQKTRMDNSACIDIVFLSLKLCKELNLDPTDTFEKTNAYIECKKNEEIIENSKSNWESIINETTYSVGGVQQTSLTRILALVVINKNRVANDVCILNNLQNIKTKINSPDSSFAKVIDSLCDGSGYSLPNSIIYENLTDTERKAIVDDISYLMEMSDRCGDYAELRSSILYVCNKLNLNYQQPLEAINELQVSF